MRYQLAAMLDAHGYRLVSTRFGIYGDWAVIDNSGNARYFTTLGRVHDFAVSLCKRD
jgi:hypothetical protein